MKLRRQRLLSSVEKNPSRVLEDRRCLKPDFVLDSLALKSPRGYFLDSIAILAILLRGGDSGQDEFSLKHLEAFDARLLDLRDWTTVRIRLRWVEGVLYARLGDLRGAILRLKSVRLELLATETG